MQKYRVNIIKTITFFVLLGITINSNAQQDYYFSHYMYGDNAYNPAAAGSHDMVSLTGIFRNQWTGFEGAPENAYFNGNLPFRLFNQEHGAGLTIRRETAGFENKLGMNAAYAYKFSLDKGKLGVGFNLGFNNNSIKGEWKVPSNPDGGFADPSGDPALPQSEETATAFDLGFGLFYKTNDLYIGLSSLHLNQGHYKYLQAESKMVRHYFLTSGYKISLKDMPIDILPSFIIASDGAATQVVLSTLLEYNSKISGGLAFRYGSAVIAMIGFELFKDVNVGYSYDYEITKIRKYQGGSHEIVLRYNFDISAEKIPEKYRSIRFL